MRILKYLLILLAVVLPACAQQAPDTSKWYIMNQQGFTTNSEQQCYKPAQDTVSAGFLSLTAIVSNVSCPPYGSNGSSNVNMSYASGEVDSVLNFTFGTIEYRAKFSGGTGTWPAIWMEGFTCQPTMQGQTGRNCNWPHPNAQEIDITEVQSGVGNQPYQNTFDSSTGSEAECRPTVSDVTQNYHVYDFVWSTQGLTWYIDGIQTCQRLTSQNANWVPQNAMFMLMNVALGGSLGGNINNATLPQSTSIDYVRVGSSTSFTWNAGNQSALSAAQANLLDDEFTTTTPPAVFFTDLLSGPKTGGQNNNGAFVTIYGTGFGSTQGASTVTIGGGVVNNCPIWGATWLWYQKITCQLGANPATGSVVVNVSGQNSTCDNADTSCNFTVRAGNIYFIATGGSNAAAGTFAAPFATIPFCVNHMVAGDICYAENGVSQVTQDNFNACLAMVNPAGTLTSPIALVSYPGATVKLGQAGGTCGNSWMSVRTPAVGGGPFSNFVLSQMTMYGGNQTLDLVAATNWRVVGNDMTCPNSPGGNSACWESSANSNTLYSYGNHMHNFPGVNKTYHGMYFSDNVNHVWVGWNSVHDGGCRGIQFHSTGQPNLFDLHVHDNTIFNIQCDGLNFATIAPQNGTVEAYNNVIYHAGAGPDPPDGESAYTCIYFPGITNAGSPGTGTAFVYNNTLYDCGSRNPAGGTTDSGSTSVEPGNPHVQFNNNIMYQLASDTGGYLWMQSQTNLISGSNNLCFGAGNCPASFGTGSVTANPVFVNPGSNFNLLAATSPASGAGTVAKVPAYDQNGVIRPAPPAIGALEFFKATSVPFPPTGLSITVLN